MKTADVVIIGAGIVGSSVAFHLTELGCRNVLLIEREQYQGQGSTGKSMGGVRAQFATPVNIQMSMFSIPFFAEFEERVGMPSGYKNHGYLFVANNEPHMRYLRTNFALQTKLGLKQVELLDAQQIAKMVPQIRVDDVLGGSFCQSDGFVDPHLVMTGFYEKAKLAGAELWRSTEVTGIQTDAQGVCGVETTNGFVATRNVVNAAGPWAAGIAKMAGVDLPVHPLRRMLVPTEPFAGIPERCPMVVDMATGFHFRPEGLGLLLAYAHDDEKPGFHTNFDHDFVEKVLDRAITRVPSFENLAVNPKRGWAGLYEVSPDHHAIIGPAPGMKGLFFANGFSGHGVMHSPATGLLTAEWVLHGEPRIIDAHSLRMERFAEGRTLDETAVL